MQGKVSKNDAIERLLRENRARGLEKQATHFASINARKEVWWYDISRKKVMSEKLQTLNILAYDQRTNDLHHLVVPTQFLRDNLEKLFTRQDKDTISLELSASRSNFLQDVRSGGGRIQFLQFLKG